MKTTTKIALLLLTPAMSFGQVPVDDDGNAIGTYQTADTAAEALADGSPVSLPSSAMEDLVGPIALYPDDLLAIVLPAAAYPLQIVEAGRFLERLESDSSLEPDSNWDDSVVALINYPEVVALLNDDLDWTLRLGEAVVDQQAEVVAAIESFRDRAYAAGNLKSDTHQTVSREDDVIHIDPVEDDVIYVPYYEPAQVVYYQPRPVYYYHPRAYPLYYYPYASNHQFNNGYFWGVTTAFSIGWLSDSLNVYHHSYYGHPYYGRSYRNNYWYRRPSISVYNNFYSNRNYAGYNHRYSRGNRWQASNVRREYIRREGYSRSDTRPRSDRLQSSNGARSSNTRAARSLGSSASNRDRISFRQRNTNSVNRTSRSTTRQDGSVGTQQRAQSRARDSRSDADRRQSTRTSQTSSRSERTPTRTTQSLPRSGRTEVRQRQQTQRSEARTTRPVLPQRSQATRSQVTRSQPNRNQSTRSVPQRSQVTRSTPQRSQVTRSQATRSLESRTRTQRAEVPARREASQPQRQAQSNSGSRAARSSSEGRSRNRR